MSAEDELFELVRRGDVALLAGQPGFTSQPIDEENRTLLHAAAESGNVDMLRWMLDRWGHGVDDLPDCSWYTPLRVACQHGHAAVAEHLIGLGADPEAKGWDGMTPLALALEANADELVAALLKTFGWPCPLCCAAERGDAGLIRWLLAHGADPDRENPDNAGSDPFTPLMIAVACGHIDIAALLIDAGASLRKNNPWVGTPLHYAAWHGNAEMCAFLLDRGAAVNDPSSGDNGAPLHRALDGNVRTVRLLLERGADPNDWINDPALRSGYEPVSPLFIAVRWGSLDIAEALLAHGADPNDRRLGATTLYQAPNPTSMTPLHAAVRRSDLKAVELLLRHGADPNVRNGAGGTPLHVALTGSPPDPGIVKLLLAKGADPTISTGAAGIPPAFARLVNYRGVTPYDMALDIGHRELAALLKTGPFRRLRFALRRRLANLRSQHQGR